MVVQGCEEITCNHVMPDAGSGHGIDFAADVFMANLAEAFSSEVVFDRDP